MDRKNKEFHIIRFTAARKQYYPAKMDKESWMPDSYVKYTEADIPWDSPVMMVPGLMTKAFLVF